MPSPSRRPRRARQRRLRPAKARRFAAGAARRGSRAPAPIPPTRAAWRRLRMPGRSRARSTDCPPTPRGAARDAVAEAAPGSARRAGCPSSSTVSGPTWHRRTGKPARRARGAVARPDRRGGRAGGARVRSRSCEARRRAPARWADPAIGRRRGRASSSRPPDRAGPRAAASDTAKRSVGSSGGETRWSATSRARRWGRGSEGRAIVEHGLEQVAERSEGEGGVGFGRPAGQDPVRALASPPRRRPARASSCRFPAPPRAGARWAHSPPSPQQARDRLQLGFATDHPGRFGGDIWHAGLPWGLGSSLCAVSRERNRNKY